MVGVRGLDLELRPPAGRHMTKQFFISKKYKGENPQIKSFRESMKI